MEKQILNEDLRKGNRMNPKDYGFVILAPDHNYGLLYSTMASIQREAQNSHSICLVGNNAKKKENKMQNNNIQLQLEKVNEYINQIKLSKLRSISL
jgi:hypothetical protein